MAGAGLSADERTVVIASGREILAATRPDLQQAFGPFAVVASTPYAVYWPQLSPDGLTLYFHADASTADVYVARRPNVNGAFEAAMPFAPLATASAGEGTPTPARDAIYYARSAAGSSGYYSAPYVGDSIGSPTALPELGGGDNLVVSADGLTVYVAAVAGGNLDVWTSHRASTAMPFLPPTPVPSVNTSDRDWPAFASQDGCRMYVLSDAGGRNLAVASRP